ncbi:MAG TPA: enoyl-CoA hydratase-related protein [bacterium]
MEYKNIILSKKEGIAVLTINRPKSLNALNSSVLKEIECGLFEIHNERAYKVLIITGAGDRSFVAGADIGEMKDKLPLEAIEFADLGHRVLNFMENMEIPVIAAVNGYALGGGCELVLACDIVIASENAKFGQPEVNLGVIPGFGGTQRLPRLVGRNRAKELIFTGDIITAAEAHDMGIVNKVVAQTKLLDEANAMALKIITKGRIAIQFAKQCINKGLEENLDQALILEKAIFANLFATTDQKEGMAAFLEKRPAKFQGK